ncbi:hypothetical protein [Holzapfeliella floricola]|uniref:Surface layer protein A domain-containing protein n=1 Tax=Holzapfeliella floricola DSM 23037 = JCM 16512 TaxID=1423744 RepID=A0A0R2DLB0_9LACO|nr:hypothetical protein [Holzapfeliella floricola]KRN04977.1 hypothetical protein FC86_GL000003 [Holzapfeliella floricola DSM 23037 = JCM 16512]
MHHNCRKLLGLIASILLAVSAAGLFTSAVEANDDQQSTTSIEPQLQSSTVHYFNGYGARIWELTAAGMVPSDKVQLNNYYIPYYGDYQMIDGIKYLHLANPYQNYWVQAQYLQNPANIAETSAHGKVLAGNVPYGIFLRDSLGNMTEQIIDPGTTWRVFATKTFFGRTYYKLGTDQQWLEDTYVKLYN